MQVLAEAPIFEPDADNYAPDNIYSVEVFDTRQKELAKRMLSDDIIEDVKAYLQDNMQPTYLSVNDYITRIETINNYVTLMQEGAVKFTKMDLIRTVVMKRIPNVWRTVLMNAGNHNQTLLERMTTLLILIKKASKITAKWED